MIYFNKDIYIKTNKNAWLDWDSIYKKKTYI